MWPFFFAALAVGLFVRAARASRGPSWPGPSFEKLSPIRQRALAILDSLLPAAYPDPKFMRIVGASFDPLTSPGTTCGALPGRMGQLLGHPTAITRYGVPGVETEGRILGAWVEALPGRRPKPGDIYLERYPPGHSLAGMIAHTGVIESATGDIWTTADAGQGPKEAPRAEYVKRRFDPVKMTLTRLDNGAERELVGWIDLDRVVFPPRSKTNKAATSSPAARDLLQAIENERNAGAGRRWPHDPGERGDCNNCGNVTNCASCRGAWRAS